jgi:hypothetical protein
LKTHAAFITRTQKEVDRLQKEVKDIEADLASSGTSETSTDLQETLDNVSSQLYVIYVLCHWLLQVLPVSYFPGRQQSARDRS